jgi:hypothetical protein
MTYTSHGHHIQGTVKDENLRPKMVARCGGPGLCDICSRQAIQETERLRTEERLDNPLNLIDPQTRAKMAVVENRKFTFWDIDNNCSLYEDLTVDDLYVFFFAYILGGWKCYISSDAWTDTSIYEVTYNVAEEMIYLNAYKKFEEEQIPDSSDYKMAKLRERLDRKKD